MMIETTVVHVWMEGVFEQKVLTHSADLTQAVEFLGTKKKERWMCPLHRAKIKTLGDLVKWSADELLSLAWFGETGLAAIRKELAARGLKLKGD